MDTYYAHIADDGRKQSVFEHLQGTAERAGRCLAGAGLANSAYLAGLLHDAGKFTSAFQSYLKKGDYGKRGSVIHTFQGCRYLLELRYDDSEPKPDDFVKTYTSELLAFAVAAHHGLFDCVDDSGNSGLQYRKEKDNVFYQEAIDGLLSCGINRSEIEDLFVKATNEIDIILRRMDEIYEDYAEYCFETGLLARLLLSAVIEGDRFDTSSFMSCAAKKKQDGNIGSILESRLNYMETKLTAFPRNTKIDRARSAISDRCREFAAQPKGIYRLNVPTGGGKTLGSLRFALAHAEKHGMKRLIFTSPLLSILEQNASVIREFVGDDSLILEHHSNVIQTEHTAEQLDERELLIQNWDAPIIITTLVQLLNCMFDGKTSSIRRFQSLCESVIVVDEVQTVPTKMLSLFNLTIRFLAEQCGATVVLCSATQPCLEELGHPLLPTPKEIVPYDPDLWNAFVRTELIPTKNMTLEQLSEFICSCMENTWSLLVVCNKKSEASFLFEKTVSDDYKSFHLSASMCMQHRRDTVSALKTSLKQGKTLCISTQVIEAGVDISFQQVIRLTAGMDSVVQSAGRCNRNGESNAASPVYVVNCSDEDLGKLQDIRRGKTATIALINEFQRSPERFGSDLTSDPAIKYFYESFYSDMAVGALDYPLGKIGTTIFDLISENKKFTVLGGEKLENLALRQSFKTAGELFSVFDEANVDVLVPYGAGQNLISQLCSERCHKDLEYRDSLLKQATNYSVSLYDHQRKRLEENGALYKIHDGVVLALQSGFYDEHIGIKSSDNRLTFLEV